MDVSNSYTEQPTERDKQRLDLSTWWQHRVLNPYVWGCDSEIILRHFMAHASNNHLELFPEDSFLLQHYPVHHGNRLSLAGHEYDQVSRIAGQLALTNVNILQAGSFGKLSKSLSSFNSIGINFLLHQMMGRMDYKAMHVFKHCRDALVSGGKLFGCTVLGRSIDKGFLAKQFLSHYNNRLIFNNQYDSPRLLEAALKSCFQNVEIELHGCIALFSGTKQ